MKRVSATDAARRFSELLDAVENRRESFLIVRRGTSVARIGPATSSNGKLVRRILAETPPDPAWAKELRELRSLLSLDDRRWHG